MPTRKKIPLEAEDPIHEELEHTLIITGKTIPINAMSIYIGSTGGPVTLAEKLTWKQLKELMIIPDETEFRLASVVRPDTFPNLTAIGFSANIKNEKGDTLHIQVENPFLLKDAYDKAIEEYERASSIGFDSTL